MRAARTGTTTSSVNIPEVELPVRPPDQVRILHFHRNVPGVLSKMHAIIAEHEVNITAEYLRTTARSAHRSPSARQRPRLSAARAIRPARAR